MLAVVLDILIFIDQRVIIFVLDTQQQSSVSVFLFPPYALIRLQHSMLVMAARAKGR